MGQRTTGQQDHRTTGRETVANSEWRVANSEWFFLEGSAHALPKKFCCLKIALRTLHIAPDLGSLVCSHSHSPNEFGAQKSVINHWLKPVAWLVVDEANRKIPCYGLQSVVDDAITNNPCYGF